MQRLTNASPADRVAKALTALGRLAKTIHILRYIHEEPLRRGSSSSSTAASSATSSPNGCSSPTRARSAPATTRRS